MHFVILGGGALGTILGAHLARAGHCVQLLARGTRAAHLERQGLTIRGINEFTAHCEIVREPTAVGAADVFINTVKTYASVAGLNTLTQLKPRLACSVQNGVVKEEELLARFGAGPVIGAMADFSGELEPDGTVLFTRNVNFHLGEVAGSVSTRVEALAASIANAGINARPVDNIVNLEWTKFTGWLALMLLAVLTRQTTGQFLQDPDTARLAARITRETAGLADRLNITLLDGSPLPVARMLEVTEDDAVAVVREAGARMQAQAPTHRMSSLQDALRGRPLELEETVGYALRRIAEFGIEAPALETCYRLVAAVNRSF